MADLVLVLQSVRVHEEECGLDVQRPNAVRSDHPRFNHQTAVTRSAALQAAEETKEKERGEPSIANLSEKKSAKCDKVVCRVEKREFETFSFQSHFEANTSVG